MIQEWVRTPSYSIVGPVEKGLMASEREAIPDYSHTFGWKTRKSVLWQKDEVPGPHGFPVSGREAGKDKLPRRQLGWRARIFVDLI